MLDLFANHHIIGIDEAGRGAWAGPLVVAAVEYPWDWESPQADWLSQQVNDSKKLSPAVRAALFERITKQAVATWSFADNLYIDRHGITKAAIKGLVNCLKQMGKTRLFSVRAIVLDGTTATWGGYAGRDAMLDSLPDEIVSKMIYVPQGDAKVRAIAAASIVAKHERDLFAQTAMHNAYPQYGFKANKGYGTALHERALECWDVSPVHRQSFQPMKGMLADAGD